MQTMLLTFGLCVALTTLVCGQSISDAGQIHDVWPDLAPGETTDSTGEKLPARPDEIPTVTRVIKITRPTISVHRPKQPNGMAAVILPGGGFSKVVPDKEGTEAAAWLNQLGVTAFVLSYRTTDDPKQPGWAKPLQDAQRTIAVIRSHAEGLQIDPKRLGIVAFSAGGQVGARLIGDQDKLAYEPMDAIDRISHRPNFAMLIYPWNLFDAKSDGLAEGIDVPKRCPPTFLVHTHDDNSSSLGTVLFYAELKRHGVPAELHVYGNGGHGYGLRPVAGSQISTWTDHAAHWLRTVKL
jgi:acetyl esterase/lipase